MKLRLLHCALVLIVVVVLVCPALASDSNQASLSVAEQYWRWRGGTRLNGLTTIHMSGTVNDEGVPGRQEIWMAADGMFWEREASKMVTTTTGVNDAGWRTNLSGQPIPLSKYEISLRHQESRLLFVDLFHGVADVHIASLPDDTYEGQQWAILRVTFRSPDTYDFYIDRSTGELHAIRLTEDRRVRYVVYNDWRFVDGIRLPFSIEWRSAGASSKSKFLIGSIAVDRHIPESLFKVPVDPVRISFSKGADGSGPLSFDFFQGRRIFVPAQINGRAAVVLLDSGAEMSVVSSQITRTAGISCGGELGVEGAGGYESGSLCNNVSIQLGSTTISGITAARMNLEKIGNTVGVPIQAILGQEVFNEYVIDIDFAKRKISFQDRKRFSPPADAIRVPLDPMLGNRVLPIRVEGRPAVPVVFDLGNGSALDLFPSYWETLQLLRKRRCEDSETGGAGGKQPVHKCVLQNVSIGGKTFTDITANLTSPGATTENSAIVKGNIGIGILGRFHLTVDYADNALYLLGN